MSFPYKKKIFTSLIDRAKELNTTLSCSLKFKHIIYYSLLKSKGINLNEELIIQYSPFLNIPNEKEIINYSFIPICNKLSEYISYIKKIILISLRDNNRSLIKVLNFEAQNINYLFYQYRIIVKNEDMLSSDEKNTYLYNMIENFIYYNVSTYKKGLETLERVNITRELKFEIETFLF